MVFGVFREGLNQRKYLGGWNRMILRLIIFRLFSFVVFQVFVLGREFFKVQLGREVQFVVLGRDVLYVRGWFSDVCLFRFFQFFLGNRNLFYRGQRFIFQGRGVQFLGYVQVRLVGRQFGVDCNYLRVRLFVQFIKYFFKCYFI